MKVERLTWTGTPEEFRAVAHLFQDGSNATDEEDSPTDETPVVEGLRLMLRRIPVPKGQTTLYRVLRELPEGESIAKSELATKMGRTEDQLHGVLGALGRRINVTPGLEGRGATSLALDIKEADGQWTYSMTPALRRALEAEGM